MIVDEPSLRRTSHFGNDIGTLNLSGIQIFCKCNTYWNCVEAIPTFLGAKQVLFAQSILKALIRLSEFFGLTEVRPFYTTEAKISHSPPECHFEAIRTSLFEILRLLSVRNSLT